MSYFLNLYTPETWAAFQTHGSTVTGFRERRHRSVAKVRLGDLFLCYLVRLSRWCGVLEVMSAVYTDRTPIFADPDPFVLRFRVHSQVLLSPENALPMLDDELWPKLSFTRDLERGVFGWAQTANLRVPLREINQADGEILAELLRRQSGLLKLYPLSERDQRNLSRKHTVRAADRSVLVEVPDEEQEEEQEQTQQEAREEDEAEIRESHRIQAALAQIGADMGFRVWIPRSDRSVVAKLMRADSNGALIDVLPLNYDDATLKTVEQIDVIWLKNRSMARAFEVEHTTAVYSGLLRMADLLALQPNMDIRLHIVAPDDKRQKVLREIRRPVFSLLDRGPLYESCTFIPYKAVGELMQMKHLAHMTESILDEFEDSGEDI